MAEELVSGIVRPDTPAATGAGEIASTYYSPALANHCLRSYVWGASYAASRHITFDSELLYVAAMLHDIGLVPEFDSHTVAFEDASGHVAWIFAAGARWRHARRVRVADVIVRHMRGTKLEQDVEGYLLEIATSLDITGRNSECWPVSFRRDVVHVLPRLTLRDEFTRCFEDQARRKPESSAAGAVARGIASRLATNVLDDAVVDAGQE